ncbi:hypothetical protein [Algoriphagus hitonicola]|uniref:Uncharacterized protein n=1 Tax=Algoriphagus hitonicola TaxID=435880 RepID=A0A1I2NN77_9BACT|nr:hypothetical protein [Algoriphagus hitonicola]SFG02741.1 hypothetical protein SAMN04487988_101103 [Algoriphagus hitonicola]
MPLILKTIERITLIFGLSYFLPLLSYAQNQPGLPKPTGPVDLSEDSNLVIYVIIPVIIIILFLIFRKKIIRVKEEKRERFRKKMEERRKESGD